MTANKDGKAERIVITRDELFDLEKQMSQQSHIKWYTFVRQHLCGKILVCACGSGYGCYIIQNSPNVNSVLGVDKEKSAIDFANRHFATESSFFMCGNIKSLNHVGPFDFLVSISTIEFLENPVDLVDMAQRVNCGRIILTYPATGSSHPGEQQYRNYSLGDIKNIFEPSYRVHDTYNYLGEVEFVFMERQMT